MNVHTHNAVAALNLARQFLQEDREASRSNERQPHLDGFKVLTRNQQEFNNVVSATFKELRT